jgi:hypothetical protein
VNIPQFLEGQETSPVWPFGKGLVCTVTASGQGLGYLCLAGLPDREVKENWQDEPVEFSPEELPDGPRAVLAFANRDAVRRLIDQLEELDRGMAEDLGEVA